MHISVRCSSITALTLIWVTGLAAQETESAGARTVIPRLVRVNSSFRPASGLPAAGVEGATLAIYREEVGGSPLWQETQNLTLEADGRYTVLLGASQKEGIPVDLFSAAEPRWLGVTFNRPGEVEQARVRIASVPYAFKASDADTLGGRPASDYLLTPAASTAAASGDRAKAGTTEAAGAEPHPQATTGTAGNIAKFTNSTDLGNSAMFESGGFIGVGTNSPADKVSSVINDPNGVITGYSVRNLASGATAYSGMLFYDQNGATAQFQGFNNSTHEYRINNIASSPAGSINFMLGGNSKFLVANSGNIGINTTNPARQLHVATPGPNALLLQNSPGGGNSTVNLDFQTYSLGINTPVQPGARISALDSNFSNHLGFFTKVPGADANALTERMRLTNTGSLGIGTTTPGSLLDVAGDITMSGSLQKGTSRFLHNVGQQNLGVGLNALKVVTTGPQNVAVGEGALGNLTTGGGNVAVGWRALEAQTAAAQATAIGYLSFLSNSADGNIGLGAFTGTDQTAGSTNMYLGYNVGRSVNESNTIRIGDSGFYSRAFLGGVRGVTTGAANAVPVVIDSNGQLGTVSSSRRFKEDIQDMGDVTRGLMRLRPVTFRYRKPFADGSKPVQYGLIAEEVAEVYPDLVAHSADGQIETVKYQLLDSMLLNEFQKQQLKIEQQEQEIETLKARLAGMTALESRLAALESAAGGVSKARRASGNRQNPGF